MSGTSIENFLRKVGKWLFLLTGIVLILWTATHWFPTSGLFNGVILVLGVLLLVLGGMALYKPHTLDSNLLLSGISIAGFLILETGMYFGISLGMVSKVQPTVELCLGVPIIPFFNQPAATYDQVQGYRWNAGPQRTVKIANGSLVYDTRFIPNELGYISENEYVPAKDSTTRRYLVFGDSYTAAYYLDRAWPDVTQALLQQSGQKVEFYSFAINGGGITNWYQIFKEEILAKGYEFDGVIFAVFANDLARDLFVEHHTEKQVYFKWLPQRPSHAEDFFQNHLSSMDSLPLIRKDEELDQWIAQANGYKEVHLAMPNLYFLTWLQNRFRSLNALSRFQGQIGGMFQEYVADAGPVTRETFQAKYGAEKFEMLREMVDTCRDRGAELIFASVPEEYGIGIVQNGGKTAVQQEMEYLAAESGGKVFDGYTLFKDEQDLTSFFLRYDGHWSQAGSDRFAKGLRDFLMEEARK